MFSKAICLSSLICTAVALTPPAQASPPSTSKCYPSCRAGFICSPHGRCVSPCNPPCGDGETCTADRRCELARTRSPHAFVILGGVGVRAERLGFEIEPYMGDRQYTDTLTSFALDLALSYELGRKHAFYTTLVGSLLVDFVPDEAKADRSVTDSDTLTRGSLTLSFGYRYLPAKYSTFGFAVGAYGQVAGPFRKYVSAGLGGELKGLFQHGIFRLEVVASPGLKFNADATEEGAPAVFALGMGLRAGVAL